MTSIKNRLARIEAALKVDGRLVRIIIHFDGQVVAMSEFFRNW